MRRAFLLLPVVLLAAQPAWALDVLASVTPQKVLEAVQKCADNKPEDIKDFACYKPGGTVTFDTFLQVAVDLRFREVDERIIQYLETMKAGVTAQPVDFSHSILTCFDPVSSGPFFPACEDRTADGKVRNFAGSYQAVCNGTVELARAAVKLGGKNLETTTDSQIIAVLFGENRTDGKSSCSQLADKKLLIYKRVANLLARQALQAGYDQARQTFVAQISTQYTALLVKMQRMITKLDLINDKWKKRTKDTYSK